jgi:hypothetical protein
MPYRTALDWCDISVRMVLIVIIVDGRAVFRGFLVASDARDGYVGLACRGNFRVGSSTGPRAGEVVKRIYTAGVADRV